MVLSENSNISLLRGVGQKKLEALNGMGIYTVYDLLTFFPASYKDRGCLKKYAECLAEEKALIEAEYTGIGSVSRTSRTISRSILKFNDGENLFDVYFYNQPYIKNTLKVGSVYRLYGTFKNFNNKIILLAPQLERIDILSYLKEGLYPVYPVSVKSGIKQKEIYNYIKSALKNVQLDLYEDMPLWLINDLALLGKNESIELIHMPENTEQPLKGMRYFMSLKFLKFFVLINSRISELSKIPSVKMDISMLDDYIKSLPFNLTASQTKTINEIAFDLNSGVKMNRLLQGDVGSGKTAVAISAAYITAKNGYQCAFTAPTEILAKQHYEKYKDMLLSHGIKSTLIYSSMKKSDRQKADKAVLEGEAKVIFGTHSLFSKQTIYKNLSLIIIDEQHRYGVMQRAELEKKGFNPHTLVMSATPIPRTLSLSIYKDLSVSTLSDKPMGRQIIRTFLINSTQTDNAYDAIKRSAALGLKTYIVCPAIDAEDFENVKAVMEEAKEALNPLKVAYLTGEMKEAEKQAVMDEFSTGDTHVLISTTVIEVGVDVANAVIMWVKSAERFGLAQLHQLRGRVGRNEMQCYCFLQTDSTDEKTMKRLNVLKTTDDGFEIAKEDLKLRGAGEMYGFKQSGKSNGLLEDAMEYPELFMACDILSSKLKTSDKERDINFYNKLVRENNNEIKEIAFN